MFVKALFESSFCFSYMLFVTAFSLKRVECVRGKSVGYLFVRRTMTATLKRTSGGVLLCEGLRYCCVGRQQSVQTSICCGNDGMTLNAQVFANDG